MNTFVASGLTCTARGWSSHAVQRFVQDVAPVIALYANVSESSLVVDDELAPVTNTLVPSGLTATPLAEEPSMVADGPLYRRTHDTAPVAATAAGANSHNAAMTTTPSTPTRRNR